MNLSELCKNLIEHGLLDHEKFKPNFTERIMREGGGIPVLQNQDKDIVANIELTKRGIGRCIEKYSPEKVEIYFTLQELANHARLLFYEDMGGNGELENKEKRKLTDPDKEKILGIIKDLKNGSYKSKDLVELTGIPAPSLGGFLAHLNEDRREELGIRYISTKNKWEKY